MKRAIAAAAVALAIVAFAAVAQADPAEYGLKAVNASVSTSQAGGHPDFTTFIQLKTEREEGNELPSPTQSTIIALPPGLLANPNAVPTCTAEQLVTTDVTNPSNETGCPQASQLGTTEVAVKLSGTVLNVNEPVFNMQPRFGEPARLGFIAVNYPILVDTALRDGPGEDYGATARIEGISSRAPLFSAKTTIWGVPADQSHDAERITPYEAINGGVPLTPDGKRSSSLVPVPVMLNPTRCGVSQGVDFVATPYMLPDLHSELFAPMSPNSGCSLLDFEPDMSISPTTAQAETGSGLDVDLSFPTAGLEHPNLLVQAAQRKVEVTLPEGMSVNPSEAAGGLGVCSEGDFDRE